LLTEFLISGVPHHSVEDVGSCFLVAVWVRKTVENCVGDVLADTRKKAIAPAFQVLTVQSLVHVLRYQSRQYSGSDSLIKQIIFQLRIEYSLYIDKPLDQIILVFQVLRQFRMHDTEKSLENDADQLRSLFIKACKALLYQIFEFRKVVSYKIFCLGPFVWMSTIFICLGDLAAKCHRCEYP
jgi:hypothetical protein